MSLSYSSKVGRTAGRIHRGCSYEFDRHLRGHVATRYGYVIVDSFDSDKRFTAQRPGTYLKFIWKGREYFRSERRYLTERGLAIVAGRFAAGVVARDLVKRGAR